MYKLAFTFGFMYFVAYCVALVFFVISGGSIIPRVDDPRGWLGVLGLVVSALFLVFVVWSYASGQRLYRYMSWILGGVLGIFLLLQCGLWVALRPAGD